MAKKPTSQPVVSVGLHVGRRRGEMRETLAAVGVRV